MTAPKPVTAFAAVSPDNRIDYDAIGGSEETAKIAAAQWYEPEIPLQFTSVTILPTEQYEAMMALCAAANALLEETSGKKPLSSGPCGMTYEAQMRNSYYRISAWVVEEIREATDALAALKEQEHG